MAFGRERILLRAQNVTAVSEEGAPKECQHYRGGQVELGWSFIYSCEEDWALRVFKLLSSQGALCWYQVVG